MSRTAARQTFAACNAFRALQDVGAAVRSIVPLEVSTLVGPFDTGAEHGPSDDVTVAFLYLNGEAVCPVCVAPEDLDGPTPPHAIRRFATDPGEPLFCDSCGEVIDTPATTL